MDVVLLIFGLAALVAIGIAGRLVDHHLWVTVLASLAIFAVVSLLFSGWSVCRRPFISAWRYGG